MHIDSYSYDVLCACIQEALVCLQVLVLDLDHTIVHTPEAADRRHFASSVEEERVFDISLFDKTLPRLLCAPRSHILEFFRTIMDKYYVVYCTAGTQSYGIAVLRGLRRFMLAGACRHEGRAGNALRQWIESSTAER